MARQRGGMSASMQKGLYLFLTLAVIGLIVFAVFKYKKEYFGNDDATITFYYMEGCGWCKKAKPEWEKCKEMAPSKNIKTKEVSADEMTSADKQKDINGFPTFIVTINGQDTKYDGERTASSMLNFADKLRLNGIEEFDNKSAQSFIRTGGLEGFKKSKSKPS